MDGKSRVVVRIMGKEYPILSADPPERVRRLAGIVDNKMRAIASNGGHSVDRVAVLAALTLADELDRLREQSMKDKEETRAIRERLDAADQPEAAQTPASQNPAGDRPAPRVPRGTGRSRPKKQ